jgi:periodic tryptophan protein 2
VLELQTDVLAVTFRPDGREVVTSSLNGALTFFDVTGPANVRTTPGLPLGFVPLRDRRFFFFFFFGCMATVEPAVLRDPLPNAPEIVGALLIATPHASVSRVEQAVASIDGRKDIQGGRLEQHRISAKNSNLNKCYTSICYSADGSCLLAGGATKYVCIYELGQHVLLKRFCISSNRSLDGVAHMLNSKNMTDAGPVSLLDVDSDSDVEERVDSDLPGVSKGDYSSRKVRPEVRTTAVQFSPTGRSWAAASTTGLLVFSLDDTLIFDPFDLDVDVTPANVEAAIEGGEYTKALAMAFRLGEAPLAEKAVEAVPHSSIALVAAEVPRPYLGRLISVLARKVETSPHVEYGSPPYA